MRGRHVVAGLGAAGLSLLVGLVGLYWWIVRPPPPPPDLASRPPPARVERPERVRTRLEAPEEAAVGRCPLEIEVLAEGRPVAGADVELSLITEEQRAAYQQCSTDGEGRCRSVAVACGEAALTVRAEGYIRGAIEGIDTRAQRAVTVRLEPGVLLDGRVTGADGEPISGAWVSLGSEHVLADDAGDYALWVPPGLRGAAAAHAPGHITERREVSMPADGGVTLDFVLHAERRVTVYCAGLPGDSCADIRPGVLCTHPALLMGEFCRGDPVTCRCPDGPVAIRGGGEAVRLEGDRDVAWLDFRRGGGVAGRVLIEGQPVEDCVVELVRVPRVLIEDLPRGLLTARSVGCDDDGRFEVEGLRAGVWRAGVMSDALEVVFPELDIGAATVDLGDIELLSGGVIEGSLVDGLTGEPVSGAWVSVTPAADGVLAIPVTGDMSEGGRFRLTGLPPGDYLVFAGTNPVEPAEVHIAGEETARVALETWALETPEDQGFSLVTGGAGELVIDDVYEGGAAEALGMAPGDVITGVRILGVDLSTLHPSAPEAALRYYPGPGMSLVVERGGRSVEIDLD